MGTETRENVSGSSGALLTAILVIAVLYFARDVFTPLALSGLLAFVLAPLATCLEHWGLRRTPAALLVVLLSLSAIGALGWGVLNQVYNLAVDLPQYQQNVTNKIEHLHLNSAGKLGSTVEMLGTLRKQIASGGDTAPPTILAVPSRRRTLGRTPAPSPALTSPDPKTSPAQPVPVRIEAPDESLLAVAGRTFLPLVHPLATTLIVVIFLIFMLLGREDLRDRGLRLAGSGRMHVTTTTIEDASRRVSRYLQMQLVVNLSYGLVAGICLWVIGIPHPLLWAVLTCLLRFVPYVGILMAAAGPLLLSVAATPDWTQLGWTVLMYVLLELVTANFAEPMLYGSSTGISAMAILVAAIFWTLLWGLPGLLLSTPLTVCLVVIGRQVPQLHYLEVLFGEETVLPASERFYHRMLAGNVTEAGALLQEELAHCSRPEVYDTVLIPALTLVESARHSEEMTSTRAEEVLQSFEELAEDITSRDATVAAHPGTAPLKHVVCVPARDFADEVACQLALQVLTETASVRVISADCSTTDMLDTLDRLQPDAICVVGIPPHALRHIRMRCHQVRTRLPEATVVASVLNRQSDLSNLRSRIPTEDAQHVVSSLQLLEEYLTPLLRPEAPKQAVEPSPVVQAEARQEIKQAITDMHKTDVFDGPEEGIFNRLATNLARAFDAPIALITVIDGQRRFWEAQCGLPEDTLSTAASERDLSICSRITFSDTTIIIPDIAEDDRFTDDQFLHDRGIRFYAGAPLKASDGEVIGSICVLDTRPREVTEQQKETLVSVAGAVITAIELHGTAEPEAETDDADPQSSPISVTA